MIPIGYQLELRHLKYFLAVAESLHYRKAAETLYISQPGLSRQIKQLEDNLGIQLFERHNRKVELTKAGTYLKYEITRHLKDLDHIINHAKLLHKGIHGNLNLGYVGSAMQQLIPELLLKFKKEHPSIIFNLREMDNRKQISKLLSKEIDIGFVRLDRAPKNLEGIPILKENFCLVLPKNHPINAVNFKNISQLKEDSFIMFDPSHNPSYYERVMKIFNDSGFTPIISHNTIHASSIYRLVENNLGISIVPKSLLVGYNMDIKFIELKNVPHQTILSIVWSKENRNPTLISFLNTIVKNKQT
ncbi:LysR substrate-binding domain-containing protein [Tenacibaculum maritimum]|uniref:LysR substrate-binding domain-containing protein n=1 Tax=Tenacibaculum maritimum TaxID=107401 RepID=UPI0012E620DD|nr:LysR substrate-binding domain-containing protein [Tenacibaculum maritimum]MCD9582172.1 LysR substrate-binding domain-containing protein [Tenacibaculum maritimum]MCD9635863.1 LysR substrate-binding domain-containing protein [Tenacibaculum maritimum]CAA0144904.1 putative transcriptional regulator, LysR family [Tenacibaculum maritimum]CAA0146248.1 putative transcriptional regulator, LysR family [Tenacibaculum maritimum]CAA0146324.1 putative transcriptional regulator, LysR family [Tenacibaculum